MALSMNESRTRRGLVAGALGGLAGVFGVAAGRPDRAAAGEGNDPDAVHKNVNNPTTASTTVTCNGATSIRAISNGGGTTKSGVFAQANGTSSRGVTGVGVTGVLGQSNAAAGNGVLGFVPGANATGVFANATSTTGAPRGVVGRSVAPNGIGVRGENLATSGDAVGVFGQTNSPDGDGSQGSSTRRPPVPGSGVRGEHQQPGGFRGRRRVADRRDRRARRGVAARRGSAASSRESTARSPWRSMGRSSSRSARGSRRFPAGSSSVVVNPGFDITPNSMILCTLMTDPGGTTTLASRDQERRGGQLRGEPHRRCDREREGRLVRDQLARR